MTGAGLSELSDYLHTNGIMSPHRLPTEKNMHKSCQGWKCLLIQLFISGKHSDIMISQDENVLNFETPEIILQFKEAEPENDLSFLFAEFVRMMSR